VGIAGLSEMVIDFFFATVEVEGIDNVPLDRPVMYAANHHSGLIDPLMIIAASPRPLRPIGKSTLWKIWPLRPFLSAADVIPIHRTTDGGGDNTNSFAAVTAALVEGEAIAIFAEGTSHDGPGLERIKTGPARMALDAVAAGAEVSLVPVGLIFEDRERFRSDAVVRFGAPIDVAALHHGASSDDRDAVRALTDQLDSALAEVAPSWESEDERAKARSAAVDALPVGASLAQVEATAERIAELRPETLGRVDQAVIGSRGQADLLVPPQEIDRGAARLFAPFAWVGKWANRPPFLATRVIARFGDLNLRATLKVIAGVLLFPLWWVAIGVVTAMVFDSTRTGLIVAAVVALLGIIAAREIPLARAERRTLQRRAS